MTKLILSVGGIGLIPFAPGTWGSLVSLPLIYFIYPLTSPVILLIFALLFSLGSGIYLQYAAKKHKLQDPKWVVLDEFAAMLLLGALSPRYDIMGLLSIFLLFRVFDIAKFWPVNFFDQKVKNGWGILLDDLAAAIQVVAVLQILQIFFPFYA